ncbi:MAG: NUDIX hydrolase [Ferruginibacter sp.]|nr:NUDIX hydrolase [Ferruginibacter sp.]
MEVFATKTLSSEYITNHQYFTARKDSYQTPSGKIVNPYFVVELPPCVVVMGITKEDKILMIKQYRHPVNDVLTELPGGFIDIGETAQQAAERELGEETGYSFEQFHYLGMSAANPGVLNNYTHFFLATGGERTRLTKFDPNEEIEYVLYSKEEVKIMLSNLEVKQSLHALCLFYGFKKLNQLEEGL